MGQRYRLLAIDVDGTLMDSRNRLPAANRDALHRAHEAGLIVCLCTGRTLAEARSVIDQLGLDSDVGIFVFGAIVARLPHGQTLHRTAIAGPLASRAVAYFQSQDYPVMVLYDPQQTGFDYRFVPGKLNMDVFERWMALSPARFERLDAWRPIPHDPIRVTIIDKPQQVAATAQAVRQAFRPDELKVNSIFAPNYGLHVVECFAPQVNKWYGLEQLARDMNVAENEIIAIGDDINDLEMIRHAGLGIAMGNAIGPIKQAADWEAPTNDDNGLAAAVGRILALDR